MLELGSNDEKEMVTLVEFSTYGAVGRSHLPAMITVTTSDYGTLMNFGVG